VTEPKWTPIGRVRRRSGRGLTLVLHRGHYVVAQYGSFDHWASGEGLAVLGACRDHVVPGTPARAHFEARLAACCFVTSDVADGYRRAGDYDMAWSFNRDLGARILGGIAARRGPILLEDRIDLVRDSIRCAQAYVVDLDADVLEVLGVCRDAPLGPWERFADMPGRDGFYPVGRVAMFDLVNLPSDEVFVAEVERGELELMEVVGEKAGDAAAQ
jgi:hypothetical protein